MTQPLSPDTKNIDLKDHEKSKVSASMAVAQLLGNYLEKDFGRSRFKMRKKSKMKLTKVLGFELINSKSSRSKFNGLSSRSRSGCGLNGSNNRMELSEIND